MATKSEQKQKADQFRALHHSGKMLVLPNIWDPLSAILLESLSYPAIATASAAIAYSNGYNDGENIPLSDLLKLFKKIVNSVNIPVSADFERGYAENDRHLQENIKQLIESGIIGINLEDTDRNLKNLRPVEDQCIRIGLIRKVSNEMGVPLFINARTDVYLRAKDSDTPELKYEATLKRGLAYKDAGADCFYPIALNQEEDIKNLISQLKFPINILTIPGIPDLKTLNIMGVARVSLGPSFLKIAIRAMKSLALQLRDYEGLSQITGNEVTSDYLKSLVNKDY